MIKKRKKNTMFPILRASKTRKYYASKKKRGEIANAKVKSCLFSAKVQRFAMKLFMHYKSTFSCKQRGVYIYI